MTRAPKSALRYLACTAVVAALTALFKHQHHINATTVALSFLVAVLIVSAVWGFSYAALMAVLATLAFNYFFLPPYNTFSISDPQNWVALFAFLATAIVASELSERARREALSATQRRKEIEQLYTFSQLLLTTDNVPELLNAVPRYLVETFAASSAAILVLGKEDVYRSGDNIPELSTERLKGIASHGEIIAGPTLSLVPLRVGVRPVGAMGASGVELSRGSLDALSTLIAIAIERTRAIEALGKAEASRESEKLRSAILDSITHEFRTPLTSIKASATTLLSDVELDQAQRHELATIVNEEADRLDRLVGEAAEMAKLDANQVELQLAMHGITEAIDLAVEESKKALADHPLTLKVAQQLPQVSIDLERIKNVLLQLIENAVKYSPAGTPIQVSAEARGRELVVSVADAGPGIDDFEQSVVFDKFYRGKKDRVRVQGTGLGLAIAKAVIEAHGGSIGVVSQLGRGSVFHFSLPLPQTA